MADLDERNNGLWGKETEDRANIESSLHTYLTQPPVTDRKPNLT